MKTSDIYYFSGTGNTKLICLQVKEILEKNDFTVNIYPIEKSNPKNIKKSDLTIFAFPVAVHTTYPFVLDFIRSLPEIPDLNTAVFTTLGGNYSGVPQYVSKILKDKKFNIKAIEEITMPNNFFISDKDKPLTAEIIDSAKKSAEIFSEKIISTETEYKRVKKLINTLFLPAANASWMWKIMRKSVNLNIDTNLCVNCGLCIKICPVENIKSGSFPVIGNNCQSCLRCFSYCPKNAIKRGKKNHLQYHSMNINDLIK
ncbi:MAG: 4Fe-4S binding protein [Thermotogae bacterium]|nr:4Fe-4S binding protein [Thermotogota bacterium]